MHNEYLPTFKRLGSLHHDVVLALKQEYCHILAEASAIVKRAQMTCSSRSDFLLYVANIADGFYEELCTAMQDGEPYKGIAWNLVHQNFVDILKEPLVVEEDGSYLAVGFDPDEEDEEDDDEEEEEPFTLSWFAEGLVGG